MMYTFNLYCNKLLTCRTVSASIEAHDPWILIFAYHLGSSDRIENGLGSFGKFSCQRNHHLVFYIFQTQIPPVFTSSQKALEPTRSQNSLHQCLQQYGLILPWPLHAKVRGALGATLCRTFLYILPCLKCALNLANYILYAGYWGLYRL